MPDRTKQMKETTNNNISTRNKLLVWINVFLQIFLIPLSTLVTSTVNAEDDTLVTRKEYRITLKAKNYTIAQGENVNSVARRFNLTPDMLYMFNQSRFSKSQFLDLGVGSVISVPLNSLTSEQRQQLEKLSNEKSIVNNFLSPTPSAVMNGAEETMGGLQSAQGQNAQYNNGVNTNYAYDNGALSSMSYSQIQTPDSFSAVETERFSDNQATANYENGLAQIANQAGNILMSDNSSQDASLLARQTIASSLGRSVELWLNQVGNSRVSFDSSGDVKNTEFDLLLPLLDNKKDLVFTQTSYHRTDDRNQYNLGFGYRTFATPDTMFGANVFFDYDSTTKVNRAGAGLEIWKDFAKFSANGYFPISSWKQSEQDGGDYYDVRAAQGFDFTAESWLPFLPQLGGSLSYEQYFGDHVNLFNDGDNIFEGQKDPYALGVGVNFQPIPLITLNADYKKGKDSKSETTVGASLTYKIGVPLGKQFSPSEVGATRSLMGSRYDFVKRNNNIVLEYKKQDLLSISMSSQVAGYGGQVKSLEVKTTSKYPLKDVIWNTTDLVAAGGQIVPNGASYDIVLPQFSALSGAVNSYVITAQAEDIHGNVSSIASSNIIVNKTIIDGLYSGWSPEAVSLSNDGVDSVTAKLTLRDSQNIAVNVPVDQMNVVIKSENADSYSAAFTTLTEVETGVYSVTVTASKTIETLNYIVSVQGYTFDPLVISVTSVVPSPDKSEITIANNGTAYNLTANGNTYDIVMTLNNAAGDPIPNAAEDISFAVGKTKAVTGLTIGEVRGYTDTAADDGKYTATVTATEVGTYTIKVLYKNNVINNFGFPSANTNQTNDSIVVVAGEPVYSTSTIATDKTTYAAGENMTVTVTLKDVNGNLSTGNLDAVSATSAVIVPNATAVTTSDWEEISTGIYTRSYTAMTAGTGLSASLQLGWSTPQKSPAYSVTSGLVDPENVVVNLAYTGSPISSSAITVAAGKTFDVIVTAADAGGNLLTDLDVLFANASISVEGATVKSSKWTNNNDGTYTATYTANTVLEDASVSMSLPSSSWVGKPAAKSVVTYSITPGVPAETDSTIAILNGDAFNVGGTSIQVQVFLKDTYGNAVTGAAGQLGSLTVKVPNTTPATVSSTDLTPKPWVEDSTSSGSYTASYVPNKVGSNLTATLYGFSGWASTTVSSQEYSIQGGTAVSDNSTISFGDISYGVGDTIAITVTLGDSGGNPVEGAAGWLSKTGVVDVPNTTFNSPKWTETEAGTYTKDYIAQKVTTTEVSPTVTFSDNSTITSDYGYSIVVGAASNLTSTISTVSTAIEAGTEFVVTVMLQDEAGNPVTGMSSSLTSSTVTMENVVSNSVIYTESSTTKGTYTASYVAKTSGVNLTATLKLTGWTSAATIAYYSIKASAPARSNSTIAVNATTYSAGTTILTSVTLQDIYGNPVTDSVSILTSLSDGATTQPYITVPNSKFSSAWYEVGTDSPGLYQREYTATTVGTSLYAVMNLDGFEAEKKATSSYAITPGVPSETKSTLSTDSTTYEAGTTITVTATLLDMYSNAITNDSSALTAENAFNIDNAVALATRWTAKASGVYTRTYTADNAGTGLVATLILSDGDVTSPAFVIKTGVPERTKSSISINASNYTAGDPINVTVKLLSAGGNAVIGAASLLNESVTVPNADGGVASWVDLKTGVYTKTYTATTSGEALSAELLVSNTDTTWTSALSSSNYTIVPNVPDSTYTTLDLGGTTFTAGDSVTATVVLKDAYSNLVTGKVSVLNTSGVVTLPNMTSLSTAKFVESASSGTYTKTFTANTVSVDNTGTLVLAAWTNSSVLSSDYSISVGTVSATKSKVAVSPVSVVAGNTFTVVVSLNDNYGNPILTNTTLDSSITVSGDAVQQSSFENNEDGTYTATYKAVTAGTYQVIIKESSWGAGVQLTSNDYTVTVGAIDSTYSTISIPNSSYAMYGNLAVTVKLLDIYKNPAVGYADLLTSSTVTVPNTATNTGSWTDNKDGTYTLTYSPNALGTGLFAALKLSTWSTAINSTAYTVVAQDPDFSASKLALSASRLVANGQSTITVTLTAVDSNGKPVPALSDLSFAAYNTSTNAQDTSFNFSTVSSNQSTGVYTTTMSGKTIGTFKIQATANSGTFLNTANVVMFGYTFTPGASTYSADVGSTISPTVKLVSSDNVDNVDVTSSVVWTASGSAVSISNNTIKANALGTSKLTGTVTYNGIYSTGTTNASVSSISYTNWNNRMSLSYNDNTFQAAIGQNTLYVMCNDQRIGGFSYTTNNANNFTNVATNFNKSGSGVKVVTVNNLNQVTKVTYKHVFSAYNSAGTNTWMVTDLVFEYQNGSTVRCSNYGTDDIAVTYDTFTPSSKKYFAGFVTGALKDNTVAGGYTSFRAIVRTTP